jgi:hypothetical protein
MWYDISDTRKGEVWKEAVGLYQVPALGMRTPMETFTSEFLLG